jgi:hypothetical protein
VAVVVVVVVVEALAEHPHLAKPHAKPHLPQQPRNASQPPSLLVAAATAATV